MAVMVPPHHAPAGRRASPQLPGLPVWDRCVVMGVLNVTPDSFSDSGAFARPDDAVRHGLTLVAEGADLVDVGGESTRPGAARVPADEELRRVVPVVKELAAAGVRVSVDTMRAAVADAAVAAGATLVNDVSGGLADSDLPRMVKAAGVPYVVGHWRGHSAAMRDQAGYGDVVADVTRELARRLDDLIAAGVAGEQVILDPGLGFAKTASHNWALLVHLAAFTGLGRPVLVGPSRKAFLGRLLAGPDGQPRPVEGRDEATAAVCALAALAGAWGVRVHGVRATADAVRVAAAWRAADESGDGWAEGSGDRLGRA